jgi:dipeptidyl-peptidase-4
MMLLQGDQRNQFGKYNDFYIARMEWTNDANLSAQVLNRHQDNCCYRWTTGTSKIVLNEKIKHT